MRTLAIILLASAAALPLASAAQAADLAAPLAPPPAATVAPAPTTNWAGAYLGANIGYGWGTVTSSAGTINPQGGMIGGQIGYNFYLSDGVVLGAQADMDWSNITDSNATYTDTIQWNGALTGHLGFAWDAVMPYVLGGVAFANNKVEAGGGSQDQWHTGWTVGAGAEVMLADNLSAFAEYRYSDYGTKDYGGVGVTGVHPTDNTVRAGLNFHF